MQGGPQSALLPSASKGTPSHSDTLLPNSGQSEACFSGWGQPWCQYLWVTGTGGLNSPGEWTEGAPGTPKGAVTYVDPEQG